MSLRDYQNLGVAEVVGLPGSITANLNVTAQTTTFATTGLVADALPFQIVTLKPTLASVVGAWYRVNFYLETTSLTAGAAGSGPMRVFLTYNSASNSVQAGQSSQVIIAAGNTAQGSKYSFTGSILFQAVDPTTAGLSFGINVDHQIYNGGSAVKLTSMTYNLTNLAIQRIGVGPPPSAATAVISTLN